MLHHSYSQGIQGAKPRALPASPSRARAASPAHRRAQRLHSLAGKPFSIYSRLSTWQRHPQVISASHEAPASPPDAEAIGLPAKAIVIGASIAGLFSAAAITQFVDSVIVLDKDAFVGQELSHDELKQVSHCAERYRRCALFQYATLSRASDRGACWSKQGPCKPKYIYTSHMQDILSSVQQFRLAGDQYLERARKRKGVPQYIQLHGLLSRGKIHVPF